MTQFASALAFIPSANLRNMLTYFRDERDHVAVRLIDTELFYRQPIVTRCNPTPIPVRDFDWTATRGDYDLGDRIGYGATEDEAIASLLGIEEDDREDSFQPGDGMAEERLRHP